MNFKDEDNTVIVEISDGCPFVISCPKGIIVEIRDYDLEQVEDYELMEHEWRGIDQWGNAYIAWDGWNASDDESTKKEP